jgi:hypothetical protein
MQREAVEGIKRIARGQSPAWPGIILFTLLDLIKAGTQRGQVAFGGKRG